MNSLNRARCARKIDQLRTNEAPSVGGGGKRRRPRVKTARGRSFEARRVVGDAGLSVASSRSLVRSFSDVNAAIGKLDFPRHGGRKNRTHRRSSQWSASGRRLRNGSRFRRLLPSNGSSSRRLVQENPCRVAVAEACVREVMAANGGLMLLRLWCWTAAIAAIDRVSLAALVGPRWPSLALAGSHAAHRRSRNGVGSLFSTEMVVRPLSKLNETQSPTLEGVAAVFKLGGRERLGFRGGGGVHLIGRHRSGCVADSHDRFDRVDEKKKPPSEGVPTRQRVHLIAIIVRMFGQLVRRQTQQRTTDDDGVKTMRIGTVVGPCPFCNGDTSREQRTNSRKA
uniref:Uncharacterized protein n=1 Tax=Plectus sambesii TaxID=2011161 RepID=A0A914XP89_9BILA